MRVNVTNIEYDTDGEEVDLPTEISMIVPDSLSLDDNDLNDHVADEISDETGFCLKSFVVTHPQFSLADKETGEVVEMYLPDILDHLNCDRSDDWQGYDEHDWMEGMLHFGGYHILLDKGQRLNWTHPCDENDQLFVTLSEHTMITDPDSPVETDAGTLNICDMTLIY